MLKKRQQRTTCSAECLLRLDKHIGDVLVFTQQREVEKDFEWLGIGRQHEKLRLGSVERLGRFVGTLFELLVVGSLLHKIENLDSQHIVCQRVGFWVDIISGTGVGLRVVMERAYTVGCKLNGFIVPT